MKLTSKRLDWLIEKRSKWVAMYIPTQSYLFALTKSELMSKINEFEAGL